MLTHTNRQAVQQLHAAIAGLELLDRLTHTNRQAVQQLQAGNSGMGVRVDSVHATALPLSGKRPLKRAARLAPAAFARTERDDRQRPFADEPDCYPAAAMASGEPMAVVWASLVLSRAITS
ncbi:MAG: hypothetical protein KY476_04130 [Planctomycetes bacterium]|nr:hypothetical protein [Planctomycetota bacterium]